MNCRIRPDVFGRFIIVHPESGDRAWSGSRWVSIDAQGRPDGEAHVCNFETAQEANDYVIQRIAGLPDEAVKADQPVINVILTGSGDLHCFKLVFPVKPAPDAAEGQRVPLEIYLHTTQALDLFSKLGAALAQYMNQASAELLEIKRRTVTGSAGQGRE